MSLIALHVALIFNCQTFDNISKGHSLATNIVKQLWSKTKHERNIKIRDFSNHTIPIVSMTRSLSSEYTTPKTKNKQKKIKQKTIFIQLIYLNILLFSPLATNF